MDRTELGAVLKDWRARLRLGDAGLPAGTRRRTPGLRREEVAQLAGMSVDYLTRLEQGRGPRPSASVLAALSRALRLSDAAAARHPDDQRLYQMIAQLRTTSPEFAWLWAQRQVHARHSYRKRFAHPQVGVLELDCDVLAVPGDDQVLIVHSAAAGSPDASALALLRVIGVDPVPATPGPHGGS